MLNIKNMRPGEEVLMVVRRHWVVYLILVLVALVGILFSIITYSIFGMTIINNLINIVFWMFFLVLLYIKWLDHELDMYVISNNRIIGVDQVSFLNRTVTECNLGQVQEVNSKTKGLFANVLNYGTLTILTAGNATNMKMDFSPNSIIAAREILNIVDNYRDNNKKSTKDEL